MNCFQGLNCYYGDLHNHCNIGYGHGSVEDALANARLQLDFACITPHAAWSDMPPGEGRLAPTVAYHVHGFEQARRGWAHLQSAVREANTPGKFIAFAGFEWHSMEFGDHHVVFAGEGGRILPEKGVAEMRRALRELALQDVLAILIPHHIGYLQGYRGINWDAFDPEFSPLVEIFSMHGAAESDDAPYPYLHTMGPRDRRSLLQWGLQQGKRVGVVGSTDHHSAHPGSYGHGRLAVWANGLTRQDIWQGLLARRTVALTGDKIALAFSINGAPLGSILPACPERRIAIEVCGGDAIDSLELLKNNRVIQRWSPSLAQESTGWDADKESVKVCFEMGWGERRVNIDWQGILEVTGGTIQDIEPRFRGHELVEPQESDETSYQFSRWQRETPGRVSFQTRTWGNPTSTTANTQAICLELTGTPETEIHAWINGKSTSARLGDLLEGPKAGYLGAFLTPAYLFHRAVPKRQYRWSLEFTDKADPHNAPTGGDWYYVRLRQRNNQCAWSSPIWVEANGAA
ncbi:MAG TPA: hypothetical protein VIO61_01415 [Anaerolineaceae bacterium]